MENRPLVPRLRFPEFRDAPAWNQVNGDRLFDAIDRRPAGRGLPVLAITQEHGAIARDEIDYKVFVTDASVATYKEVRPGDFIISLRSFQGGIEYARVPGICSPAYVILKRKGDGADDFYRHLFKSKRFIQQITRTIEGIRDGKMISYKQFSDQLLPAPDPDEQQKVAECLTSLDEVIAAEGRKLAALRDHKKGLLQNLFPREGETTPRLRFPEFRTTGQWHATTIGANCRTFSGGTPDTKTPKFYGGPIPFIRSAEIGSKTTELSLAADGLTNSSAKLVEVGDVLLALYGANSGDCALAPTAGAINQAILCLRPSGSKPFLHHFLVSRKDWIVSKYLQGGQGNLSAEIVKSIPLLLPNELEQIRITSCLGSLDTLITAQSQKLDTLKTHKQGLMQGLFPSQEVVGGA